MPHHSATSVAASQFQNHPEPSSPIFFGFLPLFGFCPLLLTTFSLSPNHLRQPRLRRADLYAAVCGILSLVVALSLFLWTTAVQASDDKSSLRIQRAEIQRQGDDFRLSADWHLQLNDTLTQAVNRGVPLYFSIEFELSHPRWYWFEKVVVHDEQQWRLSYHPINRQYRLEKLATANAGLYQSFASLEDALRVLAHLRQWRVMTAHDAVVGKHYRAAVRLRLDNSQLPRPFQIGILGNRDWQLD